MEIVDLKHHIRDVPNFPHEGFIFKDISTLLKNPQAFSQSIDALAANFMNSNIDYIVGVEARGFIIGAPLAYKLGALSPCEKRVSSLIKQQVLPIS